MRKCDSSLTTVLALGLLAMANAAQAQLAYVPFTECAGSTAVREVIRVVDIAAGQVVKDLPLTAPGGPVLIDPVDNQVLAWAVEFTQPTAYLNEIAVIDPRQLEVTRRISYPYLGHIGASIAPVVAYRAPGAAEVLTGFRLVDGAFARVTLQSGAVNQGNIPADFVFMDPTGDGRHFVTRSITQTTALYDGATAALIQRFPASYRGLYADTAADRFYSLALDSTLQPNLRADRISTGTPEAQFLLQQVALQDVTAIPDPVSGNLLIRSHDLVNGLLTLVNPLTGAEQRIATLPTPQIGMDLIGRSVAMVSSKWCGAADPQVELNLISLDPPYTRRSIALGPGAIPFHAERSLRKFIGPDLRVNAVPAVAVGAVETGSFAWWLLTLAVVLTGIAATRRRHSAGPG